MPVLWEGAEVKPRLLDLFCGAGGAAVGYARAGFEVVGVDIKPQPRYPFEFVQANVLDVLDVFCQWRSNRQAVDTVIVDLVSDDGKDVLCDLVSGPVVAVGRRWEFDVQMDEDRARHGSSLGDGDKVSLDASGAGCKVGDGDTFLPSLALDSFDAIHASPPCQAYSAMSWHPQNAMLEHPDLVEATRDFLIESGKPYVIENVEHAPLIDPVRLCGSSFGLPIRRHRLFETNWPLIGPPCAHGQHRKQFKVWRHGEWIESGVVPVYGAGGGKAAEHWAAALEIDWMTRPEMAEAIPPAYTELIGHQLLQHIRAEAVA